MRSAERQQRLWAGSSGTGRPGDPARQPNAAEWVFGISQCVRGGVRYLGDVVIGPVDLFTELLVASGESTQGGLGGLVGVAELVAGR